MNNEKERELNKICTSIRAVVNVDKIILFGSYAYGTPNKDSDFDICVLINDDNIDEIQEGIRILNNIETKMPLDLIVNKTSRFNEFKTKPCIQKTIFTKGRILYE